VSNALNYLLKARPDAMGHYFSFLKDAGTRLDPKTRDLISVISKVHVQTEGGLKQYLGRALRNGATAEEVLDALLMAFPILGLAKIVWATNIILDMNIPEFDLEAMTHTPEWHDVAAEADIPVGKTVRLEIGERGLFIHRTKDDLHVYDSRCPHQVTNIPELALDGTTLTCPKHEWKFDITTGDCIEKGDQPLKQLDARFDGGRLLVLW
jgi:nitrite reductase/ring-hydroxylating ferredoxin subunit/alkylhydroperoxidase/carboxymuconolactone decarboxylase family protein YurZ